MVDERSPALPLVERRRWLTFLLPFAVYMVVTSLEPSLEKWKVCAGHSYPIAYATKIALTLVAMALVLPGYRKFPFRISPLAIIVGIVGGLLWVGLCSVRWEEAYLFPSLRHIGLKSLVDGPQRPAFNPFDPSYDLSIDWAWSFLAVRFFGLVAVVPIIEEFFLRGFVMRFVMERNWWEVPFGKATWPAVIVGTALPVLSHPPSEYMAVVVWFTLITMLMLRTKNIWDCVAAHALTNLILGLYVVHWNEWRLM
jgi:uncharacterized protein